jgi:2-polyprenyl-6-methoxyphenol hydroxylase-like FAD-dependent oxidoreductase
VVLGALISLLGGEGVEIRWGSRVEGARGVSGGWEVIGESFDLLVVADGARSVMRKALLGEGHDRGYGWGAHWFIGSNHGSFQNDVLHQVVNGTRCLAGFLPTGREREGGEDLVSLFWSIRVAEDAAIRSRPLKQWKEGIIELCPLAEDLLSQIEDWEQVLTARYGDVRMRRWHGDRLVFIGDAGHAMSPQLGQGVNLALEDASCLAGCLAKFPLEKALPEYSRLRGPVLRYYQFATRWLTPVFQSDYEWISPIRHGGFRVSQRIPIMRKMMTRSMAGMMRGI